VSFVPVILATLFTIPWKILDNTVREMEPFYQMNQVGGASVEDSLSLDYVASVLFTTPFKAFRRGHFIVLWSSLISLAVMILPSLASEATFVSITGTCSADVRDYTCRSAWAVYPRLIRAIQAVLSFIAVLVVLMIVCGYRRTSGVYSEPHSIAGLASLLSHPSALETFRQIDSTTKRRKFQRLLAGKRFALADIPVLGQGQCRSIIELEPKAAPPVRSKWLPRKRSKTKRSEVVDGKMAPDFDKTAEEDVLKPRLRISRIWWAIRLKLYYYLAIVFLCGFFILIAFYHVTTGKSGFENWMDSGTYGQRFEWTLLGTAIKVFWNYLDQGTSRPMPHISSS
jgi:hypothetical protein